MSSKKEESVIRKVASRFFTKEFQGVVTGFVKEHKANFQGLTPRELSGEDNKLEYFEAYQKFLSAYDESLEGFLKAEGITREEFEKLCAEAYACADLTDDSRAFVSLMLATSDYQMFLDMMSTA